MKYIQNINRWKVNENMSQAKSILRKLNIDEKNEIFLQLKELLKNHLGYIGWFTDMIFNNDISLTDCNTLIDIIKNNKYVIDSLPMNLIDYTNWEKLWDDILKVRDDLNIKKILNKIPKILRDKLDINAENKQLLLSLSKNENIELFISKIARYKNSESFFNALKLFLKSTGSSYNGILSNVVNSGAEIIVSSKNDDLIICSVNYKQLRNIAGDTSWCIVPSESTFNAYVSNEKVQYVIFLTDLSDNYSKIGTTIGNDIYTSHLKNDKFIDKNSLRELLLTRNFDINSLLITQHKIVNSNLINTIPVKDLIKIYDFNQLEIIDNRVNYTQDDLRFIDSEYIDKFNLLNKIRIDSFKELMDLINKKNISTLYISDFIVNNINNIEYKFTFEEVAKLNLPPRILSIIIDKGLLYKNSMDIIDKLNKLKSSNIDIYQFPNDVYDKFDTFLYSMKYVNINPNNTDLEYLNSIMRLHSRHYHYNDAISFYRYLEMNGYDMNDPLIIVMLNNFASSGSFIDKRSQWIHILSELPELKSNSTIKKIFTDGIETSKLYDSSIEKMKSIYPDLYDDVKFYSARNRLFDEFKSMTIYSNYAGSDNFVSRALTKENITFDEYVNNLYNKYYPTFSKQGVPLKMESKYYVFLIAILLKSGHVNEVPNLNINMHNFSYLLNDAVKYSFDKFLISRKTILPKEFTPTSTEQVDLQSELIKVDSDNTKIYRYKALSLIYYVNDWGFNNYIRLVKNLNPNDSKLGSHTSEARITYFVHIFNYNIDKNDFESNMSIIDDVLSWDMSEKEKEITKKWLLSVYSYSCDRYLRDNWIKYIKYRI